MILTRWKTPSAMLLALGVLGGTGAGFVFSGAGGQDAGKKQPAQRPQDRSRSDESRPTKVQQVIERLQQEIERLQNENDKLKMLLAKQREEQAPQKGPGLIWGQTKTEMAKPSRLEKLSIKVYPVAALTSPAGPDGQEARSLMRVLANTIEPQSWKEMGGEGSMEYFPEGGCLVIRQTPEVHQQVRDLLDTLRRVKKEHDSSPRESSVGH
jgi:hypothetical protein